MNKSIVMIMILAFALLFSGCASEETTAPEETQEPETAGEAETAPEEPAEVAEPEVADETDFVPPLVSSGTVQILGREGFDPLELTVSAGDSVDFVNTLDKTDTLVFKKQGVVTMENTDKIEPGATYTKTFDETGVYEFWAVGFGPVGAKITVE